jgi:hypothetical protein
MPELFKGTINVDIRDSEPDWSPFEPPRAPEGAPNVLSIVLADVGFSAMGCYGGPIETPNIDQIVSAGVRYTQLEARPQSLPRGRERDRRPVHGHEERTRSLLDRRAAGHVMATSAVAAAAHDAEGAAVQAK